MNLDEFLDTAEHNTRVTRAKQTAQWARLTQIDSLFERSTGVGIEPEYWLKAVFLSRSHSAYRASTRLATSGQVPEAYMVMRGCLETAVYAHLLSERSDLRDAWLKRGDSEGESKVFRRAFRISDAWPGIEKSRPRLGDKAHALYDLLIAHGAHPNDHGTARSMGLREIDPREIAVDVAHMKLGDEAFDDCLLLTECVGLMGLLIFNTLYVDKFEELGVRAELHQLTLTSRASPIGVT